MKHEYDLFEKFPDGSSLWRACVIGLEGTRRHMRHLAQRSQNRFYALHLVSGRIVFHDFPSGGFMVSSKAVKRGRAAAA